MTDARSRDGTQGPARFDRRSFIARSAAVVAAGGGLSPALASAHPWLKAKPAPPLTRSATPPNILVIIVDQMRYPRWFGAAGPAVGFSPNLQRLRSSGVSFARHYTASNDCTPARAALLTGLHTHQTGCMITGVSTLSPKFDTWGDLLGALGYKTYYFGKWHLTRGDRLWNDVDGPPTFERYGFSGGTYPSPNGAPNQGWHADPSIASQFIEWYSSAATQQPWCTTVSFVNPHDIAWWYRWTEISPNEVAAPSVIHALPPNFETPKQLVARNKPLVQRSLQETTDLSFGDVPYGGRELKPSWLPFLDLYVKLQLAVDAQIGRVLDALASHPAAASNTIVLFTADHGEYGGSHGLRGKGAGLYEEGINVPLIVNDLRGSATSAPKLTRSQLTSHVDFVPLLLSLATGSSAWRKDSGYAHLASRHDLAAILSDPRAPGRSYALHATDEIVTEYALEPYNAAAPLHVVGLLTPNAKYGVYSHWRPNTIDPLATGQDLELYDYSTTAGRLEIANVAGHSELEPELGKTLASAIKDELHAQLPEALRTAQQAGFSDYFKSAANALHWTSTSRRHELQQIGTDLGGAIGGQQHRRHRTPPAGL